jgi:chromosome segregation ATPase
VTVPQELLGTIPGWITSAGVVAMLGLIVRWQLGLKKLSVEAQQVDVNAAEVRSKDAADKRDHIAEEMSALRANIATLREELHACEDECAEKIKKLHDEIWGEKRQRVTEQISLINVILNSVDAPELKALMKTLESVQRSLGAAA